MSIFDGARGKAMIAQIEREKRETAVIVARDLGDMASDAGLIGLKYGWAERYLGEAFEDLRDEPDAIAAALAQLRHAQRETAALIAELERLK